ncbi:MULTISPECIES: sulfite exporter TauE/SafE family protein [unclassified Undibacterium]|uniref:sulfite exporter TauE/SafE family protein n=1 Tax=unclassified Undibacterium TaxID=2630295 RepID=UPI002AC97250|nr:MULTISPECIES: TSUP family transporter [unclassified Undibacterium]MEB0137845.1 TSUP family transporter [Undibacterium sp. CCC2.1]MEB0170964.1 TSUP family transporter [Undibacterium sp. CCC1.1]MEB0175009.1 TSUP family transporter [Undibacterium sp. CCC3.4]MEB0215785.1 TSUP family transporter [Undibacterium sp. 5I2]WPX44815.1 TSUP family transporter [Undibacterium sp. CCC3.4]
MINMMVLGGAAFFAGFVDAIVGGGGLVQVPALFSMMPGTAPATLIGTSKFAGVWGTTVAARNYVKRVQLRWAMVLPAALMSFIFSFAGAYLVTHVSPEQLRKALPFVLFAVAVYTFKKKDFGAVDAPPFSGSTETALAMLVGAAIGFYDGFFGPGTGSFFMFLFVRVFGYDFLRASAIAKVLNVACNVAALIWFGFSGHILWQIGAVMAACGICGSLLGTKMAIKHGTGFVRKIFLFVVVALICKTSYDGFLR